MFIGVPLSETKDKLVVEAPKPKPALDDAGRPLLKDGRPVFIVRPDKTDFAAGKPSPIKQVFHDRFTIDSKKRATPLQLAVFHVLARTTEWAEAEIVVDGHHAPVRMSNGNGQAAIVKYGNRSATRTIQQLCDETGGSYDAVRKALSFWESLGIIKPIRTYEKDIVKEQHFQAGRPIEFRRYEIDADYVWNGPIWIGVAYSLSQMSIPK